MNPQILIDEIKLIGARLDALEKRNSPATAAEIAQLVTLAKTASTVKVDSGQIGEKLAQYLPKQSEIEAVRNRILDASTQAAARIEEAGARKQGSFADNLGFWSLRAFLLLSALPIFLCGVFLFLWLSTRQEREKAQKTADINVAFANWVERDYPKVFQKYLDDREQERSAR